MTQAQIAHVLGEFNTAFSDGVSTIYSEDIWMDMEEISEVILFSNENIYPDSSLQVKFDSEQEVVLVREGYLSSGSFVPTRNAYIIPYDQVIGFMVSKGNSTKSPYKRSSTI